MSQEAAEEQETKPAEKGPSALPKILMVVVLALVSSASGGVVSYMLISRTLSAQSKTAEKPEKAEADKVAEMLEKGAVLPLEPFVVNLADTEAARYLRIKISLLVDNKAKLKEVSENEALQLKVRDVILQSLTSKTSQDLISQDGKDKLRHEIQEKAAIYFREPKLVDVMFTEFVIQL